MRRLLRCLSPSVLVAIALIAASCSQSDPTPTGQGGTAPEPSPASTDSSAPPGTSPTSTGDLDDDVSSATPDIPPESPGSGAAAQDDDAPPRVSLSPRTLPTRDVTFRVRVPANTPPEDQVYVLLMPFANWSWTQHVPLSLDGDGRYSGIVSVEEGALVRYVYDRWDESEWGEASKESREAHRERVRIENRYLLVTPDVNQVEDVIETWNDLRSPADGGTGSVAGTVVDSVTGMPLMDINVSIGGVHSATDWRGEVRFERMAAGSQSVGLYQTTGDYRPASTTIGVERDETATFEVRMDPAEPVSVTFDLDLPPDTPQDAVVRLVGSVRQAGTRPYWENGSPLAADLQLPTLERVGPLRARATLMLHEGTYLQYFYSIGGSSWGREHFSEGGSDVFRSMVVSPEEPDGSQLRRDRVESWRPPGSVGVTLYVTTPPDTPLDVPVAFEMGPTNPMDRVDDHRWVFRLFDYPGNTFQLRYLLGGYGFVAEGTPGLPDGGFRTVVIPDSDAVVEHRIERWAFRRAAVPPEDGELAEVRFRVTVPFASTPRGESIRLVGSSPLPAGGVAMTPQAANPWMYEATVLLPDAENLVYTYERGLTSIESSRQYDLDVRFREQTVNDWVSAWSVEPPVTSDARAGFVNGMYTPDFWSPEFLKLSRVHVPGYPLRQRRLGRGLVGVELRRHQPDAGPRAAADRGRQRSDPAGGHRRPGPYRQGEWLGRLPRAPIQHGDVAGGTGRPRRHEAGCVVGRVARRGGTVLDVERDRGRADRRGGAHVAGLRVPRLRG